jgi:hypothetical protein
MAEAKQSLSQRQCWQKITIARCIARDAVEDQIRAEGRKLRDYALRDINVLTQAYASA